MKYIHFKFNDNIRHFVISVVNLTVSIMLFPARNAN